MGRLVLAYNKSKRNNIVIINKESLSDKNYVKLMRLSGKDANSNDLISGNILMDKEDFFYEVSLEEYDYKLKLVGDVILGEGYRKQADSIMKMIAIKEGETI